MTFGRTCVKTGCGNPAIRTDGRCAGCGQAEDARDHRFMEWLRSFRKVVA